MSEPVERLRSEAESKSPSLLTLLIDDAADRIEELEAALRYISEAYGVPNDLKQIACRALKGKP